MDNVSDARIYVDQMTSDVHLVDARALLTPEAIAIIRQEVRRQIMLFEQERCRIDEDTRIDSRAAQLDGHGR